MGATGQVRRRREPALAYYFGHYPDVFEQAKQREIATIRARLRRLDDLVAGEP